MHRQSVDLVPRLTEELGGLPLEVWDYLKEFLDLPNQFRLFATNRSLASLKNENGFNRSFISYLDRLDADSARKILPLYRRTQAYKNLLKKFNSSQEMSDEEVVIFALTREHVADLMPMKRLSDRLNTILIEKKLNLSGKTQLHLDIIKDMLTISIYANLMDMYERTRHVLRSASNRPVLPMDTLNQFKLKLESYHTEETQGKVNYLNLSGANFSNFNSAEQNLCDWNFTGANLAYANFQRCNVTRANFAGADLLWANFSEATFDLTIFTNSRFFKAIFEGVDNVWPLCDGSFYSSHQLNFDDFKKEFNISLERVRLNEDLHAILAQNTIAVLSNIKIDLQAKIDFLESILPSDYSSSHKFIVNLRGVPLHIDIFTEQKDKWKSELNKNTKLNKEEEIDFAFSCNLQ